MLAQTWTWARNFAALAKQHPLTRDDRISMLQRWARWQLASRFAAGPIVVPFVGDAVLVVEPSMVGATGNVYFGLHEFEEMAFVTHLLRAPDLFADVGSNIGAFSILASKIAGAETIAIEPVPSTYASLVRNLRANNICDRVQAMNVAIACKESASLRFTSDMGPMNRALAENESYPEGTTTVVTAQTLDKIFARRCPVVMKIDVEGFESEVIAGGRGVLADSNLRAIVIELNGSGEHFGFDEEGIFDALLNHGFVSATYDPFARALLRNSPARPLLPANYIMVRDWDWVAERLATAVPISVIGRSV